MSEHLDQLHATLDRAEIALTAMDPDRAAREIARLTAEVKRLQEALYWVQRMGSLSGAKEIATAALATGRMR